jgi:putative ubiquitin-RnfH superfamily antitoxin RatB of RatAB toxin-antitoxin module
MLESEFIAIEIVFTNEKGYKLIPLMVKPGTTIEEAISLSGILQVCPEITEENLVGIYGQIKAKSEKVRANDRVEIYRPIVQEARTLRQTRASQKIKTKRNWAKDLRIYGRLSPLQNKWRDDDA